MLDLSFPVVFKFVAHTLTSIAIGFELKDFINDKKGEKHRDLISILLLVIDIILIHYVVIK